VPESSEQRTATLPDGVALHARPAANLVRAAAQHPASITLRANGKKADAKSILQVLGLGAKGGTEVEVEVSGEGAEATADAIAVLLASLSE
jgi:phosphotransferase system HPr (HPr) family protein